jgi:hypothetical protein
MPSSVLCLQAKSHDEAGCKNKCTQLAPERFFWLLNRYAAAKKLCENFPGATIYLTTKSEKITPQVKKSTEVVFILHTIILFSVNNFVLKQ